MERYEENVTCGVQAIGAFRAAQAARISLQREQAASLARTAEAIDTAVAFGGWKLTGSPGVLFSMKGFVGSGAPWQLNTPAKRVITSWKEDAAEGNFSEEGNLSE